MTGKIVGWSDSDDKMYLSQVGSSDGKFHTFSTTSQLFGQESNAVATPTLIEELQKILENTTEFDVKALEFVDFSEDNPFGDPF